MWQEKSRNKQYFHMEFLDEVYHHFLQSSSQNSYSEGDGEGSSVGVGLSVSVGIGDSVG